MVRKVAQVATDEKDRPAIPVIIFNCGELELRKKQAPEQRSCVLAKKIRKPHRLLDSFGSEGALRERI